MITQPIDEIVGCNVRGRLQLIQELLTGVRKQTENIKQARQELADLLEFFPDEREGGAR